MNLTENGDGWQRLHPLTPLLRSVQLLYALVIAGFAASLGAQLTIVILLIAMAAIAAWITASYLRFRYRLDHDSLIIVHGVLFRKRRVIPRSRIQNVDLRAGLFQQLFRVTTARVETAGGQATEATLHVVSRADGVRLRDELVTSALGRSSATAHLDTEAPAEGSPDGLKAQAEPAHDTYVRRVSVTELAIAGATSNRAGLLVGALLGGDYFFDFMPTDWLLRRFLPPELVAPETAVEGLVEIARRDVQTFFAGLVALVLFFGLAGWAISILGSVVRFFQFKFVQTSGELHVSYGLFTSREKGFRRSRVQNVQIEEPILRRWLGLAALLVQTAGYGPGSKADERMETLTPITRATDIGDYLRSVYPDFAWEAVEWRPSHPRARRRLFIRRAAVIVLASAVLSLLSLHALILLLALVPAWFLANAHYRHLGHARSESYVLVREGLWNRRTYIVPVRKIQALHFRQTPFQRRLGLGTLSFETAGNPFEWHAPRSIDLGKAYGLKLQSALATQVTTTGLSF